MRERKRMQAQSWRSCTLMVMEAEIWVMRLSLETSRLCGHYFKLWRLLRGQTPLKNLEEEPTWQHLGFRLPVSGAMREYISVAGSHQAYGNLSRQSWTMAMHGILTTDLKCRDSMQSGLPFCIWHCFLVSGIEWSHYVAIKKNVIICKDDAESQPRGENRKAQEILSIGICPGSRRNAKRRTIHPIW